MPVIINGTTGVAGVDGSASTPAVQGTDTNTGMFFPAADTIAFAEGGTEVMRIDSSGNLRVGSSSTALNSINSTNTFGFKNRIINGAMVIDQRNAGASVTANDGVYPIDRFKFSMTQSSKGTGQQSTVAPAGFINSLLFTSSSAYSVVASDQFAIAHVVEGLNVADLGWGTANAQTVTLSFWVRSSLTGTFGGALQNSGANRSYPFTYSISSANTWEYKTVTIAGDTSGTWLTTNGIGIRIWISLGMGSTSSGTAGSWSSSNFQSATGATSVVGTNGATFYITGVQLEKGSTATSFDYRPYGTELALCQRYFQIWNSTNAYPYLMTTATATNALRGGLNLIVPMRTSPTMTFTAGTTFYYQGNGNGVGIGTGTVTVQGTSSGGNVQSIYLQFPFASTAGAGYAVFEYSGSSIQASAEL